MCWWINKLSGHEYFEDIKEDIIVQCSNVMLTCNQKSYDSFDIYTLWCSGVNIFNVDRTVNDECYFNNVKDSVLEANSLHNAGYYRPIGLSVTMSIKTPVDIDERVDILIVKDVIDQEDLLEFKKRYLKSLMPLLLWYSEPYIKEIDHLIKFSDGLVLDMKTVPVEFLYRHLLLCEENHKAVFCLEEDMIRDYDGNNRRIMNLASELVKSRVDGVVLVDNDLSNAIATVLIRAIVTSMRYLEDGIQPYNYYYYSTLSLKLKSPALPYLSISLSACVAALTGGAGAIIVLTASGRSARWLSRMAPPCPVLAITTRKSTARRLHLYRGVMPLLYDKPRVSNWHDECRNRVRFGTDFALTTSLFNNGAKLVVLEQSAEGAGYCNELYMVSVPFKCDDDY